MRRGGESISSRRKGRGPAWNWLGGVEEAHEAGNPRRGEMRTRAWPDGWWALDLLMSGGGSTCAT